MEDRDHEVRAAGSEIELDGGRVQEDLVPRRDRPDQIRVGDGVRQLVRPFDRDLEVVRAAARLAERRHYRPPQPDHASLRGLNNAPI